MTVAELRAALAALPPEADGWTVALSRDAQGNAYSPAARHARGLFEPTPGAPWTGDFVLEADLGPTDEEWCANALCLWPVR